MGTRLAHQQASSTFISLNIKTILILPLVQSAGVVEYTDCTSAEGQDPPKECPGYDTRQSDGEAPVMLDFGGMRSTPSLPLLSGPPDKGPTNGLNRTKRGLGLLFFAFQLRVYAKLNCSK